MRVGVFVHCPIRCTFQIDMLNSVLVIAAMICSGKMRHINLHLTFETLAPRLSLVMQACKLGLND